jgi:hypothetical protein
MIRMCRTGQRFEQLVEAGDATFLAEVAPTGDARLAGADASHGEEMLSAIAEVLNVIDDGLFAA